MRRLTLFEHTHHRRRLEELVREQAPQLTGKTLDIGSKSRRYDHLFSGNMAAVDVRPDQTRGISYGDLDERLPFADSSFDSVLCLEVLEYVRDADHSLAEIRRVLRPGGQAILSVPFLYHDHGDRARYTAAAWREKLQGFSEVRVRRIGNGWTVLWDMLLKKTAAGSGWRAKLGWLLLLAIWPGLRAARLTKFEDRYYSGLFFVLRR